MQGSPSATEGKFNGYLSDNSATMLGSNVRVHAGGAAPEDFPSLRHEFGLEHRIFRRRQLNREALAPLRVGALRAVTRFQDLAGANPVCYRRRG